MVRVDQALLQKQGEFWPTNVPRDICVYLAGFFDGEGHIALYYTETESRRHGGFIYSASVTNQDMRPLLIIKQWFGGDIKHRNRKDRNEPYKLFRWIIRGDGAVNFLKSIYPFLIVKRAQADLFISIRQQYGQRGFGPNGRPRAEHEAILRAVEDMKRLKKSELHLNET